MHVSLLPLFGLALITGLAQAQTVPGLVTKNQPSKVFDTTTTTFKNMGATQIQAAAFYKLVMNPPGTWTACLTIPGLGSAYGGSGSTSVVMGTYNMEKNTFTPDKRAAALNTTGLDFGLHISKPLGRYAVLDHSTGPVISVRTKLGPTDPFPKPTLIGGVNAKYIDPAVGWVNGKLMLFWVDGLGANNQISMAPLVKGLSGWSIDATKKVVVAKPSLTTNIIHSPSPITDSKGGVIGLFLAERAGSDSNMYFKDSLDPSRPHMLVNKHPGWQNNGGITGGRFHWADASTTPTPQYQKTAESRGSWIIGGSAKIGQTVSIYGGLDMNVKPWTPNLTVLMASAKLGTTQITVPSIQHTLGLGLKTIIPNFGMLTFTDKGQRARLDLPVPNDTRFRGIKIFLQGLSIQPKPKALIFSNTTELRIL